MKASKNLFFPVLATQVIAGLMSIAFAQSAQAVSNAKYLWSDSKGFVQALNCQESLQNEVPFSVVDGLKAVQIGKSKIKNRALVTRKTSQTKGYQYVQVIGVSNVSKNASHMDALKEQGYVKDNTVLGVQDFILEVKNTDQTLQVGNINLKVSDSFWQAAMTDDKFQISSCGAGANKKDYVVFEMFTKESMDPLATVGVSLDETMILQSLVIDNANEAEAKLGAADVAPDDLDVPKQNSTQTMLAMADLSGVSKTGPKPRQMVTENLSGGRVIFTTTKKASSPSALSTASVANLNIVTTAPIAIPAIKDTKTVEIAKVAEKTLATNDVTPTASLDYVVCSDAKGLRVRDQKLQKVLFTVDGLDDVKLVQSFGTDKQETVIDGKTWTFVKIQAPDEEGPQDIGWIASDFIKEKSQCDLYKADQEVVAPLQPVSKSKNISGIDDDNCCTFPTSKRPTDSYKIGMRRFGAGRSHGRRVHGACDLYRQKGDPAVAIANGKVIRNLYLFYQGVYALEVMHEGGFVVRYGEVLGRTPPGVKAGHKVHAGETLGYIGKVNSGCCKPMLHFEVYSGDATGPLTQLRQRPMQRRSDIINPTSYLTTWEKRQFGTSY